MKRPSLVHFTAIESPNKLAIKGTVTLASPKHYNKLIPIYGVGLLSAHCFKIKLELINTHDTIFFEEIIETSSLGQFTTAVYRHQITSEIKAIRIFEISEFDGIEVFLGDFDPTRCTKNRKIVICDFDKTLVETRFSNPIEIYKSLTTPIKHFSPVPAAINILKTKINEDYTPIILSASPHFYKSSIENWLFENGFKNYILFLKDYRQILSFFHGALRPKDIKTTGAYKLTQLLNTILMTGIPKKLVLIGDNFESDPIIYMSLAAIIQNHVDPWIVWNNLKKEKAFKLSNKQATLIINKIHQLKNLMREHREELEKKDLPHDVDIQIFIRRKGTEKEITSNHSLIKEKTKLITLF